MKFLRSALPILLWAGLVPALVPGSASGLAWGQPAAEAARAAPEAGSAWQGAVSQQRGSGAAVVSANPHMNDAALRILQAGGSAVDAAIAAVLVGNVVEPQSAGIGGGAFLVHFDAATGELRSYDGRESAPELVDTELFLTAEGEPMAFFDAVVGGRSVGVPGLLRMFEAAHRAHGRLHWADLFAPALTLARDGFAVSPRLHSLLARDPYLVRDAAARGLFYDAFGAPLAVGTRLRNPALALTLQTLATEGAEAFYQGELAADLVAAVQTHTNPGFLSAADLAAYEARVSAPLCAAYRGYRLCGAPPPSSGASTVLALLGILEAYPLPELASDSAFVDHLFAEAGRLAFADRDAWVGDPAQMPVAVEALLAPAYLAERRAQIRLNASLQRAPAGIPRGMDTQTQEAHSIEAGATTHLSIVDAEGNAVSLTASIESAFGSRVMVRGFLLNNQLTDFSFRPHLASGLEHPNRVAPGVRPRSSMAPMLVFDAQGHLHAVLGSPGGSRIINYVAAALVGMLDHGLAAEVVLARPHLGSRNGPTEVEDTPAGRARAARLELFGHDVHFSEMTSGLALIVRAGEAWHAAADPRREGVASILAD